MPHLQILHRLKQLRISRRLSRIEWAAIIQRLQMQKRAHLVDVHTGGRRTSLTLNIRHKPFQEDNDGGIVQRPGYHIHQYLGPQVA